MRSWRLDCRIKLSTQAETGGGSREGEREEDEPACKGAFLFDVGFSQTHDKFF